jgi:trimethylamine--corrinoid protein Co-methyltransferase
MSALLPALAGSSVIYGMGMTELGMVMSYDQLIIDSEIVKMTRRIMDGIRFNDDTLAVEVIEAVGPAGTFLNQRHTLKHLRQETSTSTLFDRDMYDNWVTNGAKDINARAHEEALALLESHKPTPLPDKMAKAIRAIIEDAEGALKEKKAFEAKQI